MRSDKVNYVVVGGFVAGGYGLYKVSSWAGSKLFG